MRLLSLLIALTLTFIACQGTSESPNPSPTTATSRSSTTSETSAPMPSPAPSPAPTAERDGEVATVTRVIDGDTIEVRIGAQTYKVRYIGIDTPETAHPSKPVECYGQEASAYNRSLVDGRRVELEKDVSETDRYGRLLRYVWVDGQMVNAILVRDGYAQVSTYPPDVKYPDMFLQLQQGAREAGRGLWSACGLLVEPGQGCEPSYPDVCIPLGSADYDCSGGSGNGPNYIRGPIRVLPPDPYHLDRDGDGVGCE